MRTSRADLGRVAREAAAGAAGRRAAESAIIVVTAVQVDGG